VFSGAELNAVFGGVDCDISGAIIEGDCYIEASAIFGGIDIKVPDGVNVKINSTSIFGGVSDEKERTKEKYEYTLYVNAKCIFGGVDIK
jgi:predicted membrane protein